MERFWNKVHKTPTCWLWTACTLKGGYGLFLFEKKLQLAHRVAWKLTHTDQLPNGRDVSICHTCDTPACVRPSHLFIGTPKINTHDSISKGRWPYGGKHWTNVTPSRMTRGEAFWSAKLNPELVREIRQRASNGESCKSLGRKYKISDVQVARIVTRRAWKHVL